MSHGDAITELPKGFVELAKSDNSSFSIIGNSAENIFGVQFHPEVFHTVNGKKLVKDTILEVTEENANKLVDDGKAKISEAEEPEKG